MSDFVEIPASRRSLSLRKPIYGVGINDAKYAVSHKDGGKNAGCPFYRTWRHMIQRCYDPMFLKNNIAYIDCHVEQEWRSFSNFKSWMEKQDWRNKDLDKDLKKIGNKTYSKDACVFITREINTMITTRSSRRGMFPIGASLQTGGKKFISSCSYKGKTKLLGYYPTAEEASFAYKRFKNKILLEASELPENRYIRAYLQDRAAFIWSVW